MNSNAIFNRRKTAEAFFSAVGNPTCTFRIDYAKVSQSLLEDIGHPMRDKAGTELIEDLHGNYAQRCEELDAASKIGANISVAKLQPTIGHVIAIRTFNDIPEPDSGLPIPDVEVSCSPLSKVMYFYTFDFDHEKFKELHTRLIEGYGADPYFKSSETPIPLAAYDRTDLPDTEFFNPEAKLPRGSSAKVRSMEEISANLKPAPRQTSFLRQMALQDNLKYDAPLHARCTTAEESERAFIAIKEAALAKGASLEDALHVCLKWDRDQPNPCGDDANILFFNRHEAIKTANEGITSSSGIKPLFPLRAARVDYFLEAPPPEKKWLIEDCLPLGKAGMLAGQGGAGKSYFALQLAMAVASGADWTGIGKVPEPRKVLYLAAEDDEHELHRRVYAVADGMAVACNQPEFFYENLRKNLYVKPMVGEDNRLTSDEWGKEVVQTDYVGRLLHTIAGNGRFGLIIIDPASRFRGGDENRASDATRFVESLEYLVSATGATVLVIHHVNKWSGREGEQIQQAARGSSAFTDGVRWQMNLAGLTANEAKEYAIPEEERGYYVTATVTKNNYAPPQPKVILKRGEGGVLSAVTLSSKKAQQHADLASRVVDLIRNEAKRGALYSKSKFEAVFGGQDGLLKTGKVALRKLLDELLQAGRIALHNRKLALPGSLIPNARVPGT